MRWLRLARSVLVFFLREANAAIRATVAYANALPWSLSVYPTQEE